MTNRETLAAQLIAYMKSEGVKSLTWAKIKKNGSKIPLLKSLKFPSKANNDTVQTIVAPLLGQELSFIKKGKVLCVALNCSDEEFLLQLLAKGPMTTQKVKAALAPLPAPQVPAFLNKLLESGKIRVVRLSSAYKASAFALAVNESLPSRREPQELRSVAVSEEAFLEHLDRAVKAGGKSQARVAALRDMLGWSDDQFDSMVRQLSAARKIQLYADYLGSLTDNDRKGAYSDGGGRVKYDISRW